jgi:DNA repair protein RadC
LRIVLGGSRGADKAHALLHQHGDLVGIGAVVPHGLAGLARVGPAEARRVAAAFELGQRRMAQICAPRTPLRCPSDVARVFGPRLAPLLHEEMHVVSLDGLNGARAIRKVSQGGLHACAVSPRDLLRVVLLDGASAFVLVHNHPSGDPTPSREDIALTRLVLDTSRAVGVPLVDHVVVAQGAYASVMDHMG